MKKIIKYKFWSLLIFGVLFLLLGAYFIVNGRYSLGEPILIAGTGQLVLFYISLFYLYKGKLNNAKKDLK